MNLNFNLRYFCIFNKTPPGAESRIQQGTFLHIILVRITVSWLRGGVGYKRCPLLGDFTVLKNVTSIELIGGEMWHLFILISHLQIHDLPTKYSRENFCTYKISTQKNLRLTNSHEEKFWTHELSTRKKFWTHEIHTQKKYRPTKAWWHGDTMTQTHYGRRPTHVI